MSSRFERSWGSAGCAMHLACLSLRFFIGQSLLAQEQPRTMTKMVVHLQSPDVPEDSFGAKPKTMYRAGTRYCRIEELPDEEHGIQGLMMINEPDTWMANLLAKTAQHYIDSGPTFTCRMPIFVFGQDIKSAEDLKRPAFQLEFGRELEYFNAKGAAPQQGPVLQGKQTRAYSAAVGDSQIFLFTTGTPERPRAIARQHDNVRDVYWYATYEEFPFDSKLFSKPKDLKTEEVKQ